LGRLTSNILPPDKNPRYEDSPHWWKGNIKIVVGSHFRTSGNSGIFLPIFLLPSLIIHATVLGFFKNLKPLDESIFHALKRYGVTDSNNDVLVFIPTHINKAS